MEKAEDAAAINALRQEITDPSGGFPGDAHWAKKPNEKSPPIRMITPGSHRTPCQARLEVSTEGFRRAMPGT
jgi:hypothetical protein